MKKVKRIKRILLCSIFFLMIIFINNKTKATYITISPSDPKVGDTVTVTVTVPNVNTVDVTAKISGIASGTIKVVGGDLAGIAKDYSGYAQYKCEKEGTLSVEITNSSTAVLDGNYVGVSASKSVQVSKISSETPITTTPTTSTTPTTTTPTTSTTTEKSNIATLSNLGIKPNDFSGFSPSKTSYSVTVPNEVESVEVYASKGQSGQKITGTGVKTLAEGENTVNVVVTAEDGTTTKTYTINITRDKEEQEEKEEEKTDETETETFGLAELKIDNIELQPQFQTDIYEYKADLTENIEKFNITTLATEANASVEITGNENLQEGENIITIIVKDQNEEKTAAYQIIVNKKIEEEQSTTDQEEQQQEKIKRIVIVVGIDVLIIIFIIIIVKIKKSKEKKDIYMPYGNIINNYNEDEPEEITDAEEVYEETKKKKRSKGKRYK